MSKPHEERNQEATCFFGDLDRQVDESLLWELGLQCGPVVNVFIPRDKLTKDHSGFGFVEFKTEIDADYACKILHQIKLFGKPVRVNKSSRDKKAVDVGANLFIGGLDVDVDERMLYDAFAVFGVLVAAPKIMRDESGRSKGFAFLSYDSFQSSDAAIQSMDNQWLGGKQITVKYALKKDSKTERHGSLAERILASNSPAAGRPPGMPMMAGPPAGFPPMPVHSMTPPPPPPGFGGPVGFAPPMPPAFAPPGIGYPMGMPPRPY